MSDVVRFTGLVIIGVISAVLVFFFVVSYAEHYSSAKIKVAFDTWKSLYLIAPHHWNLSKESCYYSKTFMNNYFVYFSVIDYIRYRLFLRQLNKKEYTQSTVEETQDFLKMMQEDIEHYKLAAVEERIAMFDSIAKNTKRHNTYISIKHL